MAERKQINLENIKELNLFTEEITVNDKDTGETKTVKTVNSAEIVTIIAYMLGIKGVPVPMNRNGILLTRSGTCLGQTMIFLVS